MRGGLLANSKLEHASISAVITRADGRVENLGTISYYHRNPLRRWAGNLTIWIRRMTRK